MSNSLEEIAKELKNAKNIIKARDKKESDIKVQLIYAFNGVGKTRLSRKFKELIEENENLEELSKKKILYYNAFTEDLFHWNNKTTTLNIYPNFLTNWILYEQGEDQNIISYFQKYTNDKINPKFNEDFSAVTFYFQETINNNESIKISKGEESNFIWCIFYAILKEVIETLNTPINERGTDEFDLLEYIFIDDPVTSLDENHLIELAVDLAKLIKSSKSNLKFIITTHNPLFYNVLYNEFRKDKFKKYILEKLEDNTYTLKIQNNDSPFSYHLLLKQEIEKAIENNNIQKYHFNYLRNILEKTATFFGLHNWKDLLPNEKKNYYSRIIDLHSHSKYSTTEVSLTSHKYIEDIKELMENIEILKFFNKGKK